MALVESASSSSSSSYDPSSSESKDEGKKKKRSDKKHKKGDAKKSDNKNDKGRFSAAPLKQSNTLKQMSDNEIKREEQAKALDEAEHKSRKRNRKSDSESKDKKSKSAKSDSPSKKGSEWNNDDTSLMLLMLHKSPKSEEAALAADFLKIRGEECTRTKAAVKQRFIKLKEDLGKGFANITEAAIEGGGANAYRYLCPAWITDRDGFFYCVHFKSHYSEIKVGMNALSIRFCLKPASVELPKEYELVESTSYVFITTPIPKDLVYVNLFESDIAKGAKFRAREMNTEVDCSSEMIMH